METANQKSKRLLKQQIETTRQWLQTFPVSPLRKYMQQQLNLLVKQWKQK